MSYMRINNRPCQCENLRRLAAMEFTDVRSSAEFRRIWNKVFRHPATLLPFPPVYDLVKDRVPVWRGIHDIPMEDIVGSFNRAEQFDRDFRPLNNASRDRWIDVRLLSETWGWKPVTLYKVGNLYFVEDGHNRISIAQHLGMRFIEARVCDYLIPVCFDRHVRLEELLEEVETYLTKPLNSSASLSKDQSHVLAGCIQS